MFVRSFNEMTCDEMRKNLDKDVSYTFKREFIARLMSEKGSASKFHDVIQDWKTELNQIMCAIERKAYCVQNDADSKELTGLIQKHKNSFSRLEQTVAIALELGKAIKNTTSMSL